MAWNEQDLHQWLAQRKHPACLRTPLGHDAAQLEGPSNPVACVDACVEGVHFDAETPPEQVGRKAAARALSDLAACGASANALLLGLCAPPEALLSDLQVGIAALDAMGRRFGAPLVGGDVCCAPGPISWTVTAMGHLDHGKEPVSRAGGQVGDALLLTGPVGGSRSGRHLNFEPRLEWGRLLVQQGVHAMMDVSDGLALDCDRLARQGGLSLELLTDQVPIHGDAHQAAHLDGRSALDHALNDGEDHELIALLPADSVQLLQAGQALEGMHLIGWARSHEPLGLQLKQGATVEAWERGGWLHGG